MAPKRTKAGSKASSGGASLKTVRKTAKFQNNSGSGSAADATPVPAPATLSDKIASVWDLPYGLGSGTRYFMFHQCVKRYAKANHVMEGDDVLIEQFAKAVKAVSPLGLDMACVVFHGIACCTGDGSSWSAFTTKDVFGPLLTSATLAAEVEPPANATGVALHTWREKHTEELMRTIARKILALAERRYKTGNVFDAMRVLVHEM